MNSPRVAHPESMRPQCATSSHRPAWLGLLILLLGLGQALLLSGCEGEADPEAEESNGSGGTSLAATQPKHAYVTRTAFLDIQTVNPSTGVFGTATMHSAGVGSQPRSPTPTPDGKFLYMPNTGSNHLVGFSIDATTGLLAVLPSSPFTTGTSPWAIAIDPAGKFLYIANNTANITGYAINSTTGALTSVPGSPITTPSGLVAITIDPTGSFLYAVRSNTPGQIYGFTINSTTGALTAMGGSPFTTGDNPSAGAITPDGKFFYAADAAGDTISRFSISASTGDLSLLGTTPATDSPQHLTIDPAGRFVFVANFQSTGANLQVLQINSSSGALSEVAGSPFDAFSSLADQRLTFVAVDPSGKFVYATNDNGSNEGVDGFVLNKTTGNLTHINTGFPSGQFDPRAMTFTRTTN